MTHETIVEVIIKSLPFPDQIEDLEFHTQGDYKSVRFNWREVRYIVSNEGFDTRSFYPGNSGAICGGHPDHLLMEALLKRTYEEILNEQQ